MVHHGQMKDVIVLGGGMSGLCAAYLAKEDGCNVTLYHDPETPVGGMFSPERQKAKPLLFLHDTPPMRHIVVDKLGLKCVTRTMTSAVYADGKLQKGVSKETMQQYYVKSRAGLPEESNSEMPHNQAIIVDDKFTERLYSEVRHSLVPARVLFIDADNGTIETTKEVCNFNPDEHCVINTISQNVFKYIFRPSPPEDCQIKSIGMVVATAVVQWNSRIRKFMDYDWVYFPNCDVPFHRISFDRVAEIASSETSVPSGQQDVASYIDVTAENLGKLCRNQSVQTRYIGSARQWCSDRDRLLKHYEDKGIKCIGRNARCDHNWRIDTVANYLEHERPWVN